MEWLICYNMKPEARERGQGTEAGDRGRGQGAGGWRQEAGGRGQGQEEAEEPLLSFL